MDWIPIAVGIIPSIGVVLIFWLVMRAVLRADRNERAAIARAEEREAQASREAPEARDDAPAGEGAEGAEKPGQQTAG